MKVYHKTKKQLIHELAELRSQNADLAKSIVESMASHRPYRAALGINAAL